MNALLQFCQRLRACDRGVAALEFCLTLPILLALTLGAYDVSRLVSTRLDQQQALTEAAGLAIAQPALTIDYAYMRSVIANAADVPASAVSVAREVKCDGVVITGLTCPQNGDERAIYVTMTVNSTYEPSWRHFSIDRDVPMSVTRVVRIQ